MAKGRRALAFALAARMSTSGCLDLKEHNGQVRLADTLLICESSKVVTSDWLSSRPQTALQLAATTNQHLIVQDLLSHGARVDTRDLWGRSALHVCAEKGHFLSLQVGAV